MDWEWEKGNLREKKVGMSLRVERLESLWDVRNRGVALEEKKGLGG